MRCEHFSGGEQVVYSPVVDLLREARRLCEQHWVGRSPCGDEECMLTAAGKLHLDWSVNKKAIRLLEESIGGGLIPPWNDTPGRTKDEVLAAFDRAIALA